MCQAYEGELNYILAGERFDRKRGYEAQKAGQPRETKPDYADKQQWDLGYDTAAEGQELW